MKVTNYAPPAFQPVDQISDMPAPAGTAAAPAAAPAPDVDSALQAYSRTLPGSTGGPAPGNANLKAAPGAGGAAAGQALTAKALAAQAKQAGLTDAESRQLETLLKNSSDFKQDSKLVRDLLATANPGRALETLLQLDPARKASPDRLTPGLVRSLTLGVGQGRNPSSQGHEGILGRQQAVIAGKALAGMPQSEYDSIKDALNKAGGDAKTADSQTERALILKATAVRQDALVNHPKFTKFLNDIGVGNGATRTIVDFAKTIRGVDRQKLLDKTSVIDLHVDGKDEAMQQRFSTSCGPTTVQITHAEADPVYAWQLHNDRIHDSTTIVGSTATEQKDMLNNNGGAAVARGTAGGVGMWVDKQLNDIVAPVSGGSYTRTNVAATNAARTAAVDAIEKTVKNGADVPIVVSWNGGGLHYQLITDVRGSGDKRQFLVTDPWSGRTGWINRKDIISGNTNFFSGTGSLSSYYQ
jgi:hypothetical protein